MLNIDNLFIQSADAVSLSEALLTVVTAILLGVIIGFTYKFTTERGSYSQNFFITLVFIPAVISVIILLIGSNVARAFSLAGAFSIIRFRSAPGNPKDITYVLFSMAAGLACGMASYIYALFFTLMLCLVMFVFSLIKLGSDRYDNYILKITVPEMLNFKGAFDDILKKYTKNYSLNRIRTADMGSVFELTYSLSLSENTDIKEFMDSIRCKNGNLTVLLSLDSNIHEF